MRLRFVGNEMLAGTAVNKSGTVISYNNAPFGSYLVALAMDDSGGIYEFAYRLEASSGQIDLSAMNGYHSGLSNLKVWIEMMGSNGLLYAANPMR